jgi:hypothetical protein
MDQMVKYSSIIVLTPITFKQFPEYHGHSFAMLPLQDKPDSTA